MGNSTQVRRGLQGPIKRIPSKGGMTIPHIATFDHGTNGFTLSETNIFAPENGWLEDDPFLLGSRPIFRGEIAVSFREGISRRKWWDVHLFFVVALLDPMYFSPLVEIFF